MRTQLGVWIGSLGLATGLATGLVGQALAQYPPVSGNVVLAAADATLTVGGQTTVSATVVDEEGNPLTGLACTFGVSQQPGADATVESGPFLTDEEGRVSTLLDVGSTPGTIVIEADCGELTASVSVVAGEATSAAPPASLPDTGTGGGVEGAAGPGWAFFAATMGAAAIAVTFALRRRKA